MLREYIRGVKKSLMRGGPDDAYVCSHEFFFILKPNLVRSSKKIFILGENDYPYAL